MSYPTDNDYITGCDHDHNTKCDRCEIFPTVFHEIQEVLGSIECSEEERDDMDFDIAQAKQNIHAWKAHLLRAINQDAARHQVLETLDKRSVILVADWAMKFLPRKFRESQSDWFGKRGIPWHLTVATRKNDNGETEMLTFVHCFESCNQDSCTVLAVIDDVFSQLKNIMPEMTCVYLRSDNAGCYHSSSTMLSLHQVAVKNGIKLERVDFSDPQGGKGACDRKAATIKSHMRVHLNSGHDIETASQMMEAIGSSGGIDGVRVTVTGLQPPEEVMPVKWEGVSYINNIAYSEKGMQVWRAYEVGSGKFLPWENFFQQQHISLPQLNKIADNADSNVSFAIVKARRLAKQHQKHEDVTSNASTAEIDSDGDSCDTDHEESKLFFCPEEGCVKSYQRFSSLQQHLDCGKHTYALEHETLYDKAMTSYATKLEHGASVVPEVADDVRFPSDAGTALPMGWALKSTRSKRTVFTVAQKNFLTEVFQKGERTGQKADPSIVAKAMRYTKQSNGARMFKKSEFLTSQQISGFFSRLAAKKNYQVDTAEDEESIEVERNIQDLTDEVMETFAPQHPIMVDTHNICELVRQSKLGKFPVKILGHFCTSLEMDVSTLSWKRKQPFIQLLENFVGRCVQCKGSK